MKKNAIKNIKNNLPCLAILLAMRVTQAANVAATNTPSAIPWTEIGAKAGADYKGDGLAVTPTEAGARLHCIFQRLDGEATPEGLWLTSTVTNTVSDRFRVTAMEVGRKGGNAIFDSQCPQFGIPLAGAGNVAAVGQTVRFSRPGLTEEYSVSMDGVRQDFIVDQSPPAPPAGELVVTLSVTGAQVEPAAEGARLVLENSRRKIAYSRLRVTDATGKELPARIEAGPAEDGAPSFDFWSHPDRFFEEMSRLTSAPTSAKLAVVVDDAEAVYPVRIDPTFSDANWLSLGGFPGADNIVNAAVADGSGNLYIGGEFIIAGNIFATNVAKWNGSSWSALASGMAGAGPSFSGPVVYALAVSGNTLYAGGDFSTAGGNAASSIAQWNGTAWSALGSGVAGVVNALAVSGDTLYAGGVFNNAGGGTANNVAQWNGNSWSALGSGAAGIVNALAVYGSTLYVGGEFTMAGGNPANYIAQWDGSNWSALGSGMGGDSNPPFVYALAVSGSTLYAGGLFTTAGGNAANGVAQWNGSSWSALGSGLTGSVNALAVSGGTLYAGGNFFTAGGNPVSNIARWNGSSWSALGSGVNGEENSGQVQALVVSGSTLYAGGYFTAAGGTAADFIAQWNGSSWSALGPASGISGPDQTGSTAVYALAISGGTLYAGGNFNTVPMVGGAANNIAQWNGTGWSALGSGMDRVVKALAVSGSTLYAAGGFSTAGGNPANYVAQWNGSSWSALGPGMDNSVVALAMSGSTLYAGGYFTMAGGNPANAIAQWNGSSWSALGSGINSYGYVYALAVSGSTLYAGGNFTTAGGNPANNIAQWNGSSWSALGSGVNLYGVNALAVSGSTLYAGGLFTTAGGKPANYVAQWNGNSWSALGSGMNNTVNALAVSGNTLYAGGAFTAAGGNPANYVAAWNGSCWSPLGSGMGGDNIPPYVYALAVSGCTLYAGGQFTTAGTNVSAYAAEALLAGPALAIFTHDAAFGFTNGVFGFDVAGPTGSNVVVQASSNLLTWFPLQTNVLGSGLLYISDPQSPTNRQRFYRAQLLP